MRWLFKIVASVPVVWLLSRGGVLHEVARLGAVGAALLLVVFLALVVIYCGDLYRVMLRLPPEARVVAPGSVWWMLVLPLNFIEDFFIVANVSESVRRAGLERRSDRWLGLGWCVAQLVSLFPGAVGLGGSVVALTLWGLHWRAMRRVLDALSHG